MVSRKLWNWNRASHNLLPGGQILAVEKEMFAGYLGPSSESVAFYDSPSSDCVTEALPPPARAHTHLSFTGLHFQSPEGVFLCWC